MVVSGSRALKSSLFNSAQKYARPGTLASFAHFDASAVPINDS
jgi:hypothetical protein